MDDKEYDGYGTHKNKLTSCSVRLEDGLHLQSGGDEDRPVGLRLFHLNRLGLAKLQQRVELLRSGLSRRALRQEVVELDLKGRNLY